ncbi:DeoR/GlpR family DNA-binding transcription regulator [Dyadobacter sp. CY107]|uniref:DeoR/GlpR family DNA-binding transcription regulator n=1 Tax=Dyadobacter fanqingshengii TaxID=2906443 RepID=UPI001F3A63CB|nr:DeoR/GlpR family DNA-binding transcription regulator [Dyadobacter fanqingshengii]MCF2502364.1 DeoR/GlpR family DNA-binding transcription regulator [Dyadobacter fanqingshengii]
MNFQERKKKILAAVEESGSLSVFELSEKLAMSPATIRRDLHDIAEEGLLLRTHGGAMKIENPVLTSFVAKAGANEENKEKIAQLAAEYVADGDIIFLDCGSTVFKMCRYLKKRNGIKVITNSLPIMAELIDVPSISLNLIGGEIDKQRKAIHGHKAIEHINGYHAHKAFIGIDGISAQNGLTAHSEHESSITSAFIRNASQVFVLCDSSKIGKDSHIKFGSLSQVNSLFTDQDLDPSRKKGLAEKGLDVVIAK